MNKFLAIFFLILVSTQAAAGVVTCSDVRSVGAEAKKILHAAAQKRAQQEAEESVGKKIIIPYIDVRGDEASPEMMESLIEVFWCDPASTPLHSAYLLFYTKNTEVFE